MNLKSLLFGSAAILAAGTGAQAADLPVAEPVEYVRICDAFGAGFYYIPGSDTCLRVGGRIRIEAHYVDFEDSFADLNNWTSRARGYLFLDARTQTDFGLVRAFISMHMQVGPDEESESDRFVDPDEDGFFEFVGGDPNYSGTTPTLEHAYIQIANDWGTFTAGHTSSFFDAPFSSNTFGTRVFIDDPTTEQTLFAYTFAGGNGFSATLSIEDPASGGRRRNGLDDYEGQEMPDLVGNIRLDQGWGTAFLAGVVGQIHEKDGASDENGIGWAVNGGFVATFGMFGAGLTASYADGRTGYITNDLGGVGDFDGPDGDDTNQAWAIRGGISAQFTPTLTAFLDASYTDFDADASSGDYNWWAVAGNVVWEPVDGLIMGPEIAYSNVDFDGSSDGDDVWGVMYRIQRDF